MSVSTVRECLGAAGWTLPQVQPPRSAYAPLRMFGEVGYCAGVTSDGHIGVAGSTVGVTQAREAARWAALRQLAYLESVLGSLDGHIRMLRLAGYVCCDSGFTDTPAVIDAGSDVYLTAFGDDRGAHARSAIGVAGLPGGALVELEVAFALEVKPNAELR